MQLQWILPQFSVHVDYVQISLDKHLSNSRYQEIFTVFLFNETYCEAKQYICTYIRCSFHNMNNVNKCWSKNWLEKLARLKKKMPSLQYREYKKCFSNLLNCLFATFFSTCHHSSSATTSCNHRHFEIAQLPLDFNRCCDDVEVDRTGSTSSPHNRKSYKQEKTWNEQNINSISLCSLAETLWEKFFIRKQKDKHWMCWKSTCLETTATWLSISSHIVIGEAANWVENERKTWHYTG